MAAIRIAVVLCLAALMEVLVPRDLWGQAIVLEPVVTGLTSPLYVTHARDGSSRLFVVEQGGHIRVLQPDAMAPTLFLDLTSRVLAGGERGLLGLAFHPQFSTNRRFFVNYTRTPDGATVIAEYRASALNPNVAETDETVLLTIAQPFANHNGGMVEFGPDGFLYVGMGDGGSGNDPDNRAQNTQDLLGKMLRIDVDRPQSPSVPYSSPSGNPFFGPDPGRDEVFALGLRNPWRFSFDRGTGQLYVADVGQGAREEVDVVTPGGNYGWRIFEGTRCTNLGPTACSAGGFIPPIAEYDHTGGRCSVTGGYVYRGSQSSLPVGAYVYGDLCTGEIFLLDAGGQRLLLDTDLSISSFGEDEAGEIYVVGLGGSVYRIVNPAAPPTAIAAELESPEQGQVVSGVALIRGWAFATQAGVQISGVDLFIDGVRSGGVPCCSERADVQAAFPQFPAANTRNSGWGLSFNWGTLSAGTHTVRVEVRSTAGELVSSATHPVTVVKAGDFEFLDRFSLAGVTARVAGEELVVEGIMIRDKASQRQERITARFRWFTSSQSLQLVQAETTATPSSLRALLVALASSLSARLRGLSAATSAQAAPGVVQFLEAPEEGQAASGIALVRGWAFTDEAGASVAEVRLVIDGQPGSIIPCCSNRGDVAAAYPGAPDALDSGWGVTLNYGNLAPGFHTVGVRLGDSSGASLTVNRGVTVVKVGGFVFVDQFDLSGATARTEGEEVVISGVRVRDKASLQTSVVTVRVRWLQNSQALGVVASS